MCGGNRVHGVLDLRQTEVASGPKEDFNQYCLVCWELQALRSFLCRDRHRVHDCSDILRHPTLPCAVPTPPGKLFKFGLGYSLSRIASLSKIVAFSPFETALFSWVKILAFHMVTRYVLPQVNNLLSDVDD